MNKIEKQMKKLAEETNLIFDGHNDTRLFLEEQILVNADHLTEKEYSQMEKEINSTIETEHYTVYAWNDSSGYKYWKKESEVGGYNYIQITVHVKNPLKADSTKIDKDVTKLLNKLLHWDNVRF